MSSVWYFLNDPKTYFSNISILEVSMLLPKMRLKQALLPAGFPEPPMCMVQSPHSLPESHELCSNMTLIITSPGNFPSTCQPPPTKLKATWDVYFPYPSYNLGNIRSSVSFMSLYILRDTRQKIPPIHIFQIYQESSSPAKSTFGSPRARTALRRECKWNVLVLQHLYFKLICAKKSYSMGQYHGFQFSVSTSPQIIILEL